MIDRRPHVQELYDLKHCHDTNDEQGADYTQFLNHTLSNRMYLNDTLYEYVQQMQELMVHMLEANHPVRNYWNHTVDKYYDRHNN